MEQTITLSPESLRSAVVAWLETGCPAPRSDVRKLDFAFSESGDFKIENAGRLFEDLVPPNGRGAGRVTRSASITDKALATAISERMEVAMRDAPTDSYLSRGVTCVKEVWVDILGRDRKHLDNLGVCRHVGKALRLAGWTPVRSTFIHPKYGHQKRFTLKK